MPMWLVYSETKPEGVADNDEVLYALILEDLKEVYRKTNPKVIWDSLTAEEKADLRRRVEKYLSSFIGEGTYNWDDAIKDAIRDWRADGQRKT